MTLDLERFSFDRNDNLCVPGTSGFIAWLQGIEDHEGSYCNDSDRTVLGVFHEVAGGSGWTNSDEWLSDGALDEWYGISVDSLGRVTALDLSHNGLDGRLPGNLARLEQMTELRVDGNALSGRLPMSLTRLPLQEFHYADTDLCTPVEEGFQAWLSDIPSHDGTGLECGPPSDRDILVALYDETDGRNWRENANWLTDAPLADWHGVEVDGQGRVIQLKLFRNLLAGSIPRELGASHTWRPYGSVTML